MKSFVLITLSLCLSIFAPLYANAENELGHQALLQEITDLVNKQYPKFINADPQEVTVHFQINAKNELVIFDTTGDDDDTCDQVKEVLNFKQLKYKQAKPLKPYVVQIKFTK